MGTFISQMFLIACRYVFYLCILYMYVNKTYRDHLNNTHCHTDYVVKSRKEWYCYFGNKIRGQRNWNGAVEKNIFTAKKK